MHDLAVQSASKMQATAKLLPVYVKATRCI